MALEGEPKTLFDAFTETARVVYERLDGEIEAQDVLKTVVEIYFGGKHGNGRTVLEIVARRPQDADEYLNEIREEIGDDDYHLHLNAIAGIDPPDQEMARAA